MDHDLTVPLTVPVVAGEALLLDNFRSSPKLPVSEQRRIVALVEQWVNELLDVLPVGTPESLIDQACELVDSARCHVGLLATENSTTES